MKNVLVINSSLQGKDGNSVKATQLYVKALQKADEVSLTEIDLAAIDLPHLSAQEMQAWGLEPSQRDEQASKLANISDDFVAMVKQADEIVIGVPMYNFGIPSVLKAFFDRIARAGVTFRYSENGPVGLLSNTRVSILAARGGMYAGTPKDTQTTYIQDFFSFLGLHKVDFYYIEGLAMGEDAANAAWDSFSKKLVN